MKCRGTNRKGQPCGNWAIKGGTVCEDHGGKAPQVKAAAQVRLLEEKARKLIPDQVEIHPDPIRRVLELAAEMDAFRESVRLLVNNLEDIATESYQAGEQVKAEVLVYERALERVAAAYLNICKLNLEERLVQIREREALAMLKALDKGLLAAGLSADQQQQVKQATARALRAA